MDLQKRISVLSECREANKEYINMLLASSRPPHPSRERPFPLPLTAHYNERKDMARTWEWRDQQTHRLTWPHLCRVCTDAQRVAECLLVPPDLEGEIDVGALTDDQRALAVAVVLGANVFATGSAGTGKSVALRVALHTLGTIEEGEIVVTSTTGVSACNIGGITLHSYLLLHVSDRDKWQSALDKRGVGKCAVLVVDEISMASPRTLYDIHARLAIVRRRPDLPAGGVQLVVSGDFFQLPPVDREEADERLRTSRAAQDELWFGSLGLAPERALIGKAVYAFQVPLFWTLFPCTVLMQRILRQSDVRFAAFMENVRYGRLTELEIASVVAICGTPTLPDDVLCLFPRNMEVRKRNEECMAKLQAPEVPSYMMQRHASSDGDGVGYVGDLVRDDERCLVLKTGCAVRLCRNYPQRTNGAGYVNGARGTVIGFVPITHIIERRVRRLSSGSAFQEDCAAVAVQETPQCVLDMMRGQTMNELYQNWAASMSAAALSGNGAEARLNADGTATLLMSVGKGSETTFEQHPFLYDREASTLNLRQKGENDFRAHNFRYREEERSALRYYLPVVRFDSGAVRVVPPCVWTSHMYRGRRSVPIVSQLQWPLLVAYASTIHRIQGASLDEAAIYAPYFKDSGLLYTALTRVRGIGGLKLVGQIAFHLGMPDGAVLCFYKHCIDRR